MGLGEELLEDDGASSAGAAYEEDLHFRIDVLVAGRGWLRGRLNSSKMSERVVRYGG